jgi:hypothetical protein
VSPIIGRCLAKCFCCPKPGHRFIEAAPVDKDDLIRPGLERVNGSNKAIRFLPGDNEARIGKACASTIPPDFASMVVICASSNCFLFERDNFDQNTNAQNASHKLESALFSRG